MTRELESPGEGDERERARKRRVDFFLKKKKGVLTV